MKIVALNLQEENWEDDGGAHDVFLAQISDEDFAMIETANTVSYEDAERLEKAIYQPTEWPVAIDGVFSAWWAY